MIVLVLWRLLPMLMALVVKLPCPLWDMVWEEGKQ